MRRRGGADAEPADVARRVSQRRRRMVPDVAIKDLRTVSAAFSMFTVVGIVLLLVVQREASERE